MNRIDANSGDFSKNARILFFLRLDDASWVDWGMPDPDMLANAPVLLDLEEPHESDVITRMLRMLAGRPEVLDPLALERAVLERQKLQPPLLGHGVALPHARTSAVSGIVLAVGRCREAVPFGPEKVPIRLVFLYGVPAHCIAGYLAEVAYLTRLLRKPGIVGELLAAENEAVFRKHLQ